MAKCKYVYVAQRIRIILIIYTDILKLIRQVAPPAVCLAAKLKLFWLVTLLLWALICRPLSGVTGHTCRGLPPANFQLAMSFRSRLRVRHGTKDRQTTAINALSHPVGSGDNKIHNMKKAPREPKTLRAGCSKAEPKFFAPPFDRAHMTSYWRSIVTVALSHVVSKTLNVEKCRDLEIGFRDHSRSLTVVPFGRSRIVSY